MSRRAIAVSLGVLVLLFGVLAPGCSAPAQGASPATKVCKVVKKHGHKKRVCTVVKTKPTATPPPTATATQVPATVSVSLASPTPGYTFTVTNGVYEVTDTIYGDRIDLSQITITKDTSNGFNYIISMNVKATKIPSSMDNQRASWLALGDTFDLTASNQHPYSFQDYGCPAKPEFSTKELYNGESTQGWVCSAGIEAQSANGNYTLTWDDGSSYESGKILVFNVAVNVPGQ